ncbi:glycoside hydrolase family 3 protein [Thalassotalea castellviae]|uniref:Exo 1,3/1,4-beta-D-glucan glucohydrolase n=1 Tax=Thalassotalea castellviae TaxID=3075612 RepID=A0ABU3A0N8_9GAMM|nr:exo 1,3/1,4-beta-D-glucan glucohydrolase [Thalassotalea sp. W431]MDT0603335.1 exo 1,3/1,4-beta-D-glucan glucohydrolase [Thalassotalea sp. W431]
MSIKINMKHRCIRSLLLVAITSSLAACNSEQTPTSVEQNENQQPEKNSAQPLHENLAIWPKLDIAVKPDPSVEAKVSEILSTMTLEQKVAQMIQPEIRDISVEDMRKYGFGSYLNGGGAFPENNKHASPADWIKLAEAMYQASIDDSLDGSTIPTMWGTDAVHGHNNVIGATLFPHNIGLGAANNPDLIEKIAAITAKEVMVTGIDWVFAPTVAVVRDDRWGRTYEGYSEDPEIVRNYSAAIVKGLQGAADQDFLGDERVISTVKHFLGDGGTEAGDDQGDNIASEQTLFDIHAQGYVGGLSAGSQSVMASFNSWHGKKNHGNKYLLTDVLKNRMGFDGFVVGDWNGHGQIKGCTNESCPQSINAGLDIFMVPTNAWKPLYENTIAQVKSGEIKQSRIDDAVSRILRVKVRAGLFEKPSPAKRKLSGKTALIGADEHRAIAQQAVRESLILLKNNENLLPLSPHQHILVTGDGADNIGKQSGGWTITWQGTGNNNADFPGGTSIYDGIKAKVAMGEGSIELSSDGSFMQKPDVAIVVFGEEPYAEGNGDLDNLEYQRGNKQDLALLKRIQAQGIKVVSVFISGRPMWVNAELNASDAFVAAWLPGSEGKSVADVLFTKANGDINHDFKGKLSFSWPNAADQTTVNRFDKNYQPLLPYGYGLTYLGNDQLENGDQGFILANDLNETSVATSDSLTELKIFELAVKKPWHVALQSGDKSATVTSNIQSLGAISLRTLDKVVQEDARTVSFNGNESASLRIFSSFPEDFRAYHEAKSVLSFEVRLERVPTDAVNLAMNCNGECQDSIDIAPLLKAANLNEWHTINIDFACLKSSGAEFAQIMSPFTLSTKGKVTLSYSGISVVPNTAEQATMSCQ